MTTRKHFKQAADYIKTHLVLAGRSEEACEAAYRTVVDLFRSDNPRFDVERFRLACGLGVGGDVDTFAARLTSAPSGKRRAP